MSCELETAVRALQRGHVRWEQVHPALQQRLAREGWDAALICGTEQRTDHQRAMQHGEKTRGAYRSDNVRRAP
jgi:hypothetical protein